ncbi:MAG: hypothetical protein BroJett011_74410 [Chloroflexota bacterium]|nr:MAG: hypothetical protein BroJett011_74410 [Chloroflexota bacterium]
MNHSSSLIQQIEQLSAESQAKLAEYVAFLQWQEAQAQAAEAQGWSFSFIEAFKEAAVYASREAAGLDVSMAPATVGGETRPALWAHPPVVGQAVIEYHVPVPQQVREVRLRLAIGIRDGAKIAPDNLVAFSVRVNGLRVWGQQSNAQSWQAVETPLNLLSGDIARIEFATEALGSHQWTWAVWGAPELQGKITE